MAESDLIETRNDVLSTIETEEETLTSNTVCGGRYTLQELSDKFWVTILDKPAPTPSELVEANKIIMDLHNEASKEKMIAQALKRKTDITILNTILENLDFCRKSLHSMIWSRSIDAKVSIS